MTSILDHCSGLKLVDYPQHAELLAEGENSDRLLILQEGAVEVYRDDVTIAIVTDPGSIFGEMSVLLDSPHTANVRTAAPAKLYVVDDARVFLAGNPAFLFPIAKLLATRLKNSTDYLVDFKNQFADHKNHFAMVDAVLDSLVHQQDETFIPAEELPPDP